MNYEKCIGELYVKLTDRKFIILSISITHNVFVDSYRNKIWSLLRFFQHCLPLAFTLHFE